MNFKVSFNFISLLQKAKDISSPADNAIFKSRPQPIECNIGCVAILLKPNVANILLFNFCEQKFVHHGAITIAVDCNGLSLAIFEEKWPNYASGPNSSPNNNSFRVHRLFNVCVRVFCAPNAFACVHIRQDQKRTSFEKIFFCQNQHLL